VPKVIDETRIFEAVVDLFVSNGFAGTTTKDVAAAAGVNEATLFRKYGSKAKLIELAIDHQWRDVPLATVTYSGDLEADLLAIVEAYLETNRLKGEIVAVLLVELARNADLGGAFRLAAANIGSLTGIVMRHQAEGRLRSEDPTVTLVALIGPHMVHNMFRRAGVGPTPTEIDAREHVRTFLDGHSTAG
jgi:AcrR family transcriptional regulator